MSDRRSFQKLNSEDYELQRLQERVEDVITAFNTSPLMAGRLVKDIALTTDFQDVEHRLDRIPLGYIVVRYSRAVRVSDDQINNPRPKKTLRLASTADATVTIWVF